VEARFLATLKTLLPKHSAPIMITDAGFRTPWFRAVHALGWHFVGRDGGHALISPQGQAEWIRVEPVFDTATSRPKYLGYIDLVRKHPLACHAYLFKKKARAGSRKPCLANAVK